MSPASEPMTFDELSELYRVEMKSNSISPVRPDLFRAMADLLTRLRLDYDKQMSIDPESVMCEGANQRRKKAERLVKDILHIRTQKICQMAIRGALGADNHMDALTQEEKDYHSRIQDVSREHLTEVDHLRGRRNTVATRIDEVPAPRPEPRIVPEPVEVQEEIAQEPVPEAPAEIVPDVPDEVFEDFPEESFDDIADEPVPEPTLEGTDVDIPREAPQEPVMETSADDLESVVLRILEDLPPFVGPDRDYNLCKEDVVTMPRIMAEALVNAEKATPIRPTP